MSGAGALALALLAGAPAQGDAHAVVTGSKTFTESVVLGEILAALADERGADAEHRAQLGGTRIVFEALRSGQIDAYVEYTGTLEQELLADTGTSGVDGLRAELATRGVVLGEPLGFDNTYALGVRPETADEYGLLTISDLALHPELRFGFSNEFMERGDGWPALRERYGLPQADVRGLDHSLAYRGLDQGSIDVTDFYATDAEIAHYGFVVLEDDLEHFPEYAAVPLWRADLAERAPEVVEAFRALGGTIDARRMTELNKAAKIDGVPEQEIAAGFLAGAFGLDREVLIESRGERLRRTTVEHLLLVLPALLGALLLGVPLGIVAAKRRALGQGVLGGVAVLWTVPSLAMLVFMLPLFGIGAPPAIAALFLYSLLPIVRGAHHGLASIPKELDESARALGLPAGARLRRVELPLALPAILSGVQTAAVIAVGTAPLGALIGAGGYGQPILTGIRLDDLGLILEGAVPAAAMALATQGLFALVERGLVSPGLRRRPGAA